VSSDAEAAPVAIIGPTASGKSFVALALARQTPGTELVSIDSMQVYRGMDIGTAKPTAAEQAEVRHHLIDLVDPSADFTVADFQVAYDEAMADVASRHARPVLVGGTGLYLQAVLDGLTLPGRFPAVRTELEAEPDTEALHRRLTELDPAAAAKMAPTNRRRIVRALEVTIGSGRRFSSFGPGLDAYPPIGYRLVGLRWSRDQLDLRIAERYRCQLDAGFLDEVRELAERPGGLSVTASQALGYKELLAHVRGEATLDGAVDLAVRRTRRFARRQERWFRRDPRVEWFDVDGPAALDELADRVAQDGR
jgi:tRNA dimethylallyltransferase